MTQATSRPRPPSGRLGHCCAEFSPLDPQAMHDDPELPRDRHARLAVPGAPGNGVSPVLQRTGRSAAREQNAGGFEEQAAGSAVTAFRDPSCMIDLTRLIARRR